MTEILTTLCKQMDLNIWQSNYFFTVFERIHFHIWIRKHLYTYSIETCQSFDNNFLYKHMSTAKTNINENNICRKVFDLTWIRPIMYF